MASMRFGKLSPVIGWSVEKFEVHAALVTLKTYGYHFLGSCLPKHWLSPSGLLGKELESFSSDLASLLLKNLTLW